MFGQSKNWLRKLLKRKSRDTQLEHFIDLLRQSALCTEQQVGELIGKFENERREVTSGDDGVSQFCRFLIGTNAVTAWQCEKLKMGKWKGFYLDDYVLLEQDGKDYSYSYYRARDTRDRSIVRLIVTPMNQTGGKIEYRVDHSVYGG
jgi:hypothetical protein